MDEHTITLTTADLDLLGRLLPEHPYKLVAPLINKINVQLAAQQLAVQQQAKEQPNG